MITKSDLMKMTLQNMKAGSNQNVINAKMQNLLFNLYNTKQLTENSAIYYYPEAEVHFSLIFSDGKHFKMDVLNYINKEILESERALTNKSINDWLYNYAIKIRKMQPKTEVIAGIEMSCITDVMAFLLIAVFK